MVELSAAVASAVILPEVQENPEVSEPGSKRRQPSHFSPDSKRRKLIPADVKREAGDVTSSPNEASGTSRVTERRKFGQQEERKRGQRLFGALLGTLSQSSSSTAQKRRADIENKQRAKLQLQADEEDERRKAKLDALMDVRRKQQKIFDQQSMKLKHSNQLALAHFLPTRTEPKLFYRPWELLPDEEDRIKKQVAETEEIIKNEKQQLALDSVSNSAERNNLDVGYSAHETQNTDQDDDHELKGKETNLNSSQDRAVNGLNTNSSPTSDSVAKSLEPPEKAKDSHDDGGEVVEGAEDTVIY